MEEDMKKVMKPNSYWCDYCNGFVDMKSPCKHGYKMSLDSLKEDLKGVVVKFIKARGLYQQTIEEVLLAMHVVSYEMFTELFCEKGEKEEEKN